MQNADIADPDLSEAIAAERRELAAMLAGLAAPEWDTQTLCADWRVREVVAHITMPFRYSAPRFVIEVIKAGGNFNRMADRCARRDAAAATGTLVAQLEENERNPWQPPGGGFQGALTHDVIHGLDITVALGIDRRVPEERLRTVLRTITSPKSLKFFGADLNGIELRADDADWSFGSGTPLYGPAQHLALVLCGRRLPTGLLRGEPSTRFIRADG
jgi:uncharacterized protein (TIGR03083 family)